MSNIRIGLSLVFLLTVGVSSQIDWTHFDGVAQVFNFKTGSVLYRQAHGDLNVEHNISMPLDAQFPIGSNTKLYCAVAAYQLQERGLLNVSAPISKYLNATDFAAFGHPEISFYCPTLMNSSVCQQITLQHLFAMSAGILSTQTEIRDLRATWTCPRSSSSPEPLP